MVGVPVPWQPTLLSYSVPETRRMYERHGAVFKRIGLVFGCSDPRLYRSIFASASFCASVKGSWGATNIPFSAFLDNATVWQDKKPPQELKEDVSPIFSSSMPLQPPLSVAGGEHSKGTLTVTIDMPERAVAQIKLRENDILADDEKDTDRPRSDWSMVLCVRLIGQLHLYSAGP